MAKILTFQTNTDKKILVISESERVAGKIVTFASRAHRVVVNSDLDAAALSFPEAWRPFIRRSGH